DPLVTGVQTCALPISFVQGSPLLLRRTVHLARWGSLQAPSHSRWEVRSDSGEQFPCWIRWGSRKRLRARGGGNPLGLCSLGRGRSEERRVGGDGRRRA